METINKQALAYKIEMLSEWHVGSGLDATTDTDALVLKDTDDLPYIPGKTIKGLLRDAMMDMFDVGQCELQIIHEIFGKDKNKQEATSIKGDAHFSNAELPATDKEDLNAVRADSTEDTSNQYSLSAYLYRNIASTAIEANGVAKDKSLRVMQVCLPVTLEGVISDLKEEQAQKIKTAFQLIRHLGVNRNRGLGRCRFTPK